VTAPPVLLLTRRDVAALLHLDDCIAAVETAFRLQGEDRAPRPGVLGYPAGGGGFHIKAAALTVSRSYFAAKINANYSENPKRFGLPAIQGLVVLCDAESGSPLAVMDSIEITILRTAAATAVAARSLARPDSRTVTVYGCGNQGRSHLRALARVLPIARASVYDVDAGAARSLARTLADELAFPVEAVADPAAAARSSDVCVTCTPSRRAFLRREDISAGAFVAAVGADAPDKQELEPALVAAGRLVVDSLDQCAAMGELHHALAEGLLDRGAVAAELPEVVAGKKPGRLTSDEIIVFDSTGVAIEDVAAAAAVYERACAAGRGAALDLCRAT